MRIISRVIITALLVILAPYAVRAQDSRADKSQGGVRPGNSGALTLSAEQRAKFDSIQKKHEPEMRALAESIQTGSDRSGAVKKMLELNDRTALEIRSILTPSQLPIFDANYAMIKRQLEAMQRQLPPL